jgi:hypothetical protein
VRVCLGRETACCASVSVGETERHVRCVPEHRERGEKTDKETKKQRNKDGK